MITIKKRNKFLPEIIARINRKMKNYLKLLILINIVDPLIS